MTDQEATENEDELEETLTYSEEADCNEFGETVVAPNTSVNDPLAPKDQSSSELSDSELPETIGRYRIGGVLGKGGFGVVYRAHDPQLDRDVAIKMPLIGSDVSDDKREEILGEFLQEARRLARLSHPGIVRVLDIAADGQNCFIVSEFLDGPNLNQWTRSGPHSIQEALTIVAAIADALAYAHSERTVHRDMKPANVILTSQADGLRPVIVDFGLALSESAENSLGRVGSVAGTPNYMSPEQIRGEGHRIDGRTDIYALGVILYRLLCGRLPFSGSDVSTLMHRISHELPVPPRQHLRSIPATVESICLKAMAKEISERYTTAGDMASELRAEIGRLSAKPEPQSEAKTPTRSGKQDAVRRQVTVLSFGCDLFESEEFMEDVDPEHQHEILREYQQVGRSVISEFDGCVLQSSGEITTACFGYPSAHEDSAARAVRAGLKLISAVQHLQERLQKEHDIEFSVWGGVHTGQAILQELEDGTLSMMGDARNVALKLENVSEDDAIVVTEATHRIVSGFFESESHGKLKVRGVSRKIGIFLILGESEARHRLDVADNIALTPMVGRDTEFALLKEVWEEAEEGDGHVVCIIGEAGLGKSRLVRELREHVRGESHESIAMEWRCSPFFQNTGLHPAIDYLQNQLGFREESSPTGRFELLVKHLEEIECSDTDTVVLLAEMLSLPVDDRFAPLELSPQRRKQETEKALSRWLKAWSQVQPILFVIEDLHWIDASTLEWINQFSSDIDLDNVLTILTFRPEFTTPWGSRSNQSQLALNRLPRDQISEMMCERMGVATIDDEAIARIVERTEGVPLFVEEFCNSLMEAGALEETDQGLQLSAEFDITNIPSTLQDLLISRLDRLDTPNDLVYIGSAIGRDFSYTMLRGITGLDDVTLNDELENLVQAELLYREGTPPRAHYTFKHALIQDAAYESLVKSRRQQYHLNIADTLEREFPETVDANPELLAYHLTQAGSAEKAVTYWLKAGQQSQARSANQEAIGHYQSGLETIAALDSSPERDQTETHFQLLLVTALMGAKGYSDPEVDPALKKARELCEGLGDPTMLVHVMWLIWAFHLIRADYEDALAAGAEMMEIAEKESDDGLIMESCFPLACTNYFKGDFAKIMPAAVRGLPLYDAERCAGHAQFTGQNSGVTIRNFYALAHLHGGAPTTAAKEADRTVALSLEIEHPFSQVHGITEAAWVYYLSGNGSKAQQLADQALNISSRFDFPFWEACAGVVQGGGLILQGKAKKGLHAALKAQELFYSTGGRCHECFIYTVLAHGYLVLEKFDESIQTAEKGIACGDETGERYMHPELLRIKAEAMKLRQADLDDVTSVLQNAQSLAVESNSLAWQLRTQLSLCRLHSNTDQQHEAIDALNNIIEQFESDQSSSDLETAREFLASNS